MSYHELVAGDHQLNQKHTLQIQEYKTQLWQTWCIEVLLKEIWKILIQLFKNPQTWQQHQFKILHNKQIKRVILRPKLPVGKHPKIKLKCQISLSLIKLKCRNSLSLNLFTFGKLTKQIKQFLKLQGTGHIKRTQKNFKKSLTRKDLQKLTFTWLIWKEMLKEKQIWLITMLP